MRKSCWIYAHRESGQIVLAQRPHRRAVNPTYRTLYPLEPFARNKWAGFEMPSRIFRQFYEYVGML